MRILRGSYKLIACSCLMIALTSQSVAQVGTASVADLKRKFQSPSGSAKPMVFWYWLQGAVTRQGITADLEVMKEAGIAGAYLMPIKGPTNPPVIDPPLVQLTPKWWRMIEFATSESKRLQIELAIHVSDGFALAGGPWITPEMSMQKVVWTKRQADGGKEFNDTLQTREKLEGFYKDISVLGPVVLESEFTEFRICKMSSETCEVLKTLSCKAHRSKSLQKRFNKHFKT